MRGESVSWSDSTYFKPNSDNMHKYDETNWIDRQMIVKDKIWIVLYKDFCSES